MKQFRRIFAVILCLTMVLAMTGCKANDYKAAVESLAAGNYAEAGTAFKALGDYKDSAEQAKECDYQLAMESFISLDYAAAKTAFEALGDYKDSKDLLAQASDALVAAELVGPGPASRIFWRSSWMA